MLKVFLDQIFRYLIVVPFLGSAWLLLGETALSHPPPRLTSADVQRLPRDLIPSSSEDFFKAGHIRLEQEVRRLTEPRSPSDKILIVNPATQNQQNIRPQPLPKKL